MEKTLTVSQILSLRHLVNRVDDYYRAPHEPRFIRPGRFAAMEAAEDECRACGISDDQIHSIHKELIGAD